MKSKENKDIILPTVTMCAFEGVATRDSGSVEDRDVRSDKSAHCDRRQYKLLPKHVAIVMDGNGRWAQQRGLPRIEGHKEGLNTVRRVIKACVSSNVEVLSLFAFSCENWQRPTDEVHFLMGLFIQALQEEVAELHQKSLRLRFLGDRKAFSLELQECMAMAEELTCNNTGMQLVLAMNYGGQWDITQAVQQVAQQVLDQKLDIQDITPQIIESSLSTYDLPLPDLFIRTSGEKRISNFFLWQIAYTELFFCDEHWPDFSEVHFQQAMEWFSQRQRRYGKTAEQVEKHA